MLVMIGMLEGPGGVVIVFLLREKMALMRMQRERETRMMNQVSMCGSRCCSSPFLQSERGKLCSLVDIGLRINHHVKQCAIGKRMDIFLAWAAGWIKKYKRNKINK